MAVNKGRICDLVAALVDTLKTCDLLCIRACAVVYNVMLCCVYVLCICCVSVEHVR